MVFNMKGSYEKTNELIHVVVLMRGHCMLYKIVQGRNSPAGIKLTVRQGYGGACPHNVVPGD